MFMVGQDVQKRSEMLRYAQHDRMALRRSPRLFIARFLIFSASVCFLAGCSPPANRVVEQTIEQVYPLTPDGIVSLINTDGSVHIYGSDVGEVRLEATKRAYTKDRLDKIMIDVSAQPGTVSIKSNFPNKSGWGFSDRSGTVDYTLQVPQTATIERVESANGEIIIEGMRGAKANVRLGSGRLFIRDSFCNMDLEIGHGTLTMMFGWWEKAKLLIQGRIEHGNSSVFMPGDASFHLMAESGTGKIGMDFTPQDERNNDESKRIDRVVGPAPAITFQLHAVDGNIQVWSRILDSWRSKIDI